MNGVGLCWKSEFVSKLLPQIAPRLQGEEMAKVIKVAEIVSKLLPQIAPRLPVERGWITQEQASVSKLLPQIAPRLLC